MVHPITFKRDDMAKSIITQNHNQVYSRQKKLYRLDFRVYGDTPTAAREESITMEGYQDSLEYAKEHALELCFSPDHAVVVEMRDISGPTLPEKWLQKWPQDAELINKMRKALKGRFPVREYILALNVSDLHDKEAIEERRMFWEAILGKAWKVIF